MGRQGLSALVIAGMSLAATFCGQAEELAVVVSPKAGEVEQFAAEELQRYLEKITGEKVSLGNQAPESAVTLCVGTGLEEQATLGEEGYTLRSIEDGLSLTSGGPRGTLYAVYDFLERLGCRWYYKVGFGVGS